MCVLARALALRVEVVGGKVGAGWLWVGVLVCSRLVYSVIWVSRPWKRLMCAASQGAGKGGVFVDAGGSGVLRM